MFGIVLFLFISPAQLFAFTMNDYLSLVKENNSLFISLKKDRESKILRQNEADLVFHPNFFLNSQFIDDKRVTTAPSFQGTQTIRKFYQAGVSENFRSGTKASFSYNVNHTEINGASPLVLPQNSFYDLAPQIEISQSLWRNFFGREDRANNKILKSQIEISKLNSEFKYRELLMKSKIAFYRLVFALQSLDVQKQSLERANKLRDWNYRRVQQSLTDEIDLLQAESNLLAKEIDFQSALTELQSAQINFNSLIQNEKIPDVASILYDQEFHQEAIKLLEKEWTKSEFIREDIQSSFFNYKLMESQAQLGIEKNRPTFELFGTYSLNGRAQDYSPASNQATQSDHPYAMVGLKFITSFDAINPYKARKAYAEDKFVADLQYRRKVFEVKTEMEDLFKRFNDNKKKLKLALKMEEIQKKKLLNEKDRYNKGRTTTFQVLQFEQDYASAQLLKLRSELEILSAYNQLEFFNGENYEIQ